MPVPAPVVDLLILIVLSPQDDVNVDAEEAAIDVNTGSDVELQSTQL